MACLPFETPKLLATAIVNEGSFAELLDRRLKRMEEMKLIEAKANPTGNAVEPRNENGGSVDARLPPQFPTADTGVSSCCCSLLFNPKGGDR
jgi:hypothetical protein